MVPERWAEVPLAAMCELINGRGFKPHEWTTKGYPIIRIQNLNGSSEFNYYDGEFNPKILVRNGELLFAWSGSRGTSFGPHFWQGNDAVLNYHTWKVLPKNGTDKSFLFQLLRHITSKIEASAHGASALVHTQKATMEKRRLAVPPLYEQKKIAEILSTWDKAIATTEKLLANAETQKKALMQQLLTGKRRLKEFDGEWREFRIDELAEVNPRRPKRLPEQAVFVAMEDVSEKGELLRRQTRPTSDVQSGYTCFGEGDVLVAKITPCFENGKGAHTTNLQNGIGFGSTEFHVLRARDERDQRLIFHIVNSYEFRGRGANNMTGSAGQRRVPSDYLKSYTIRLPVGPRARQEIAAILDNADAIWRTLNRQQQGLHAEKKALMQQLLTGKRRVAQ